MPRLVIPNDYDNKEKALEAYFHHRFHPTPRQLAGPLTEKHQQHLEECERCKKIYDVIMQNIDRDHATAYCDYDGNDFNAIHVGDIRTFGFDYLATSKHPTKKFINAPEVCVIASPPKISFSADVLVAQAFPARFEKLMSEGDFLDGDYIIESWNMYHVPMMALIDFKKSLFPTVYKSAVVRRDTLRAINEKRNKRMPSIKDKHIQQFRTEEYELAKVIKRLMYMTYRDEKKEE